MTSHPEDDNSRSYASAPKRRRRYSVWTLLAPAAAVILWISFFSALGKSCVFKECADAKDNGSESQSDGSDTQNKVPRGGRAKVKNGDTVGIIAARFDLTEEELKACNPTIDPQALQPGQFLVVSAIDCEDADKAEVGANPDPLAGDTTAGVGGSGTAPDPTENGTAAADPSAQPAANADASEEG